MKPADQLITHDPANGKFGDCQRAVIASLLSLPIEDVPHFGEISKGDPEAFWTSLQEFCESKGYAYLTVPARSGFAFYCGGEGVYHEICGPSPRGDFLHVVVGCDGQIVHDPHPSRAGLAGDPATWTYSYLVFKGQPT